MGAGHDHGSSPSVPGAPADHRVRLWIAFGLTATIVLAQAIGSVITGSLALLTDTAHAITDASGLLVALIAATLMLRPANPKRTWGFRRIEVIAALGQAALLLVVGTYAAVEGVRRLFEPPEVAAGEMLVFGIIQLGWALHCASSVQYALERASRIVILDPDADATDVRAAMNAFLDDTARDEFGLTMEDISINGAAFARMTSTYDHAVDIPFVPVFSLHFTSVQLEPRPDT